MKLRVALPLLICATVAIVPSAAEVFDPNDPSESSGSTGSSESGQPLLSGDLPPVLFDPEVQYQVGLAPAAITVADLDEDGSQDIVVTNRDSNTLSILFGNGDG